MALSVLFLTKYGRGAASSRLRYLQYIPRLEAAGIDCETQPLLDDVYLEKTFNNESVALSYLVNRYWRRLRATLSSRRFDVVVLQYEAFPYIPAWLEHLLGVRVPYVLDIDDAIFHGYDSNPKFLVRFALGKKIRAVLRSAACVLAGSPYLVDYARAENCNVDWAPTCVDINRFPMKSWREDSGKPFTIGWIGAPSTARYAAMAVPAIRELAQRMPVRLLYIGSGPVVYENVTPEVRAWSEETEIADLLDFDVGIMPLPDDPWTRGKCAFKLIQYMACGLPVVASPVGMNNNLVQAGRNGFLAASREEWLRSLETIGRDVGLRSSFGRAGRCIVEKEFTSEIGGNKLLRAIELAADQGDS
jgi:glycosyltransferase involved in cell wall biosynthesis